jgi:hypothetical protein
MKLTGEYELTDQGVVIEGQIKDSHIHEVRALFKPFKTIRIYRGEVEQTGQVYHVPHPQYRPYIIRNVPGICTPEREREFVALPTRMVVQDNVYYHDCVTFSLNMGVMYSDCDGRTVMSNGRVFSYLGQRRQRARLVTNSAWVWGADESGNFKIEMLGMVNRHIMTVVLANATKLAKYIDTVLVRALDKPEEFTQEKIVERTVTQRRPTSTWV